MQQIRTRDQGGDILVVFRSELSRQSESLLRPLTRLSRRRSGEPVRPNLVSCLVVLLQPDSLYTPGRYIRRDGTYVGTVHGFSVLHRHCYRPYQRFMLNILTFPSLLISQ